MPPPRVPPAASSSAGSSSRDPPSSLPPPDTPDVSGDSGSDFEDTRRPRGKRGPPRTPTHVPKRPRSGDTSGDSDTGATNALYAAVVSGKGAVETLADEWLETYKRDREGGLLELLNFVVRSCGCRGTVTPEMFRNLPNSEIIRQLTEKFDEDSPEYPLSRVTPPWRRFRAGFSEFLTAAVSRCRHDVAFDGFLLDALAAFLTGLADSPVRAFRHTATLAAVKVMTALVAVAAGVGAQQENVRRQLDAERGKGIGRRATERLEALAEKRRELREQQEEMEAVMNAIFKGVFVHRYRDIVPDIRAICMEELGTWMRRDAAAFVTDGHLKYLGWTLHDKQREVRLRCVKALQGLYGRRDTAALMELFTARFKARMVAMVLDKEPEVAVEAVTLLTLILENMEDALTEDDCQHVYPAVYVASRPLAAAAGRFVYRRLLAPRDTTPGGDTSSDIGDNPGDNPGDNNRSFLLRLVAFFLDSELHEHAAYLVDSLWDCAGERLRDWEALGGLLLEEPPGGALTDQQEKALVDILAAAAQQATSGRPPPGRGPPKKASWRWRRAQEQERSRLSHCFLPALPPLLAKFSAEGDKVTALLEVLCCCDLGVFCTGRMEKHLELTLAQLRDLVTKHSQEVTLVTVARALLALSDPRLALGGRGDTARGQLADEVAQKCHRGVTRLLQDAPLDDEDVYSTAATLRRLAALFNAQDLTPWRLFDPCARLLRHAGDTGQMPPQVLVPAVTCLQFHVLWELSRVPDEDDVPEEQIRSLKNKVVTVVSLCQSCLSDPHVTVREQAFIALSDLLLVFGPQLSPPGTRAALSPLVVTPDVGLQSQLAAFLMDHVFQPPPASPAGDTEGDIAALHRRRLLLAGFCKLVIYDVLELAAASDVFKHYAKFYGDFGDIIKETLSCARRGDPLGWARTMLLSLEQLLAELLLEEGPQLGGGPRGSGRSGSWRGASPSSSGPPRCGTAPRCSSCTGRGCSSPSRTPPEPSPPPAWGPPP